MSMNPKFFLRQSFLGIILVGTVILSGCHGHSKKYNTVSSGTVNISVDESYQPLIDSEIKVFEAQNPQAHIIPHYEPESDCFRDLLNDSSHLIIVTRDLDQKEVQYFKDIRMPMTSKILAWDAVTLIVNPENPDTNMTMQQVREIMEGSPLEKPYQIVFDDANSSTYRYVLDSINHGKPLPPTAMAAKGSENVVNYVAKNINAIGVIGVSWVSDPADSLGLSFLQKTRVVAIKGDGDVDYFKPYQAYIALKSYPLTRAFYFILREAYSGLGTGFANFLGGNVGQLIIGKYRLFPARLDIVFRKATIQ